MKMQHNFISDLPARRRRVYFIPRTPKKISGWVPLAMSAWTSDAAATSSGIHGGPVARRS